MAKGDAKAKGRPRCRRKTKAGKPCKNGSLPGRDHCMAHAPAEEKESRGFGGSQPGSGRPRKPRAVEVLRERIERDIEKWLQPLEDARGATRGLVVAIKGGGAELVEIPDHSVRLAAVRDAFDRAYGKPTQPTELTGEDGGPIEQHAILDTTKLSKDELKVLRGLLRKGGRNA